MNELNYKMSSILADDDERILFRPILAYKIKPDKNAFFGMMQANWRYLMFSNRKLYNIDPKVYNEGNLDRAKLIKNQIDIDYFSHLIFFPQFEFDSYTCLDPQKLRPKLAEEFKKKKVDVILGFAGEGSETFNEGDIALETDMLTLLQLIHVCQLVCMDGVQQDFIKQDKIL